MKQVYLTFSLVEGSSEAEGLANTVTYCSLKWQVNATKRNK